MVTNLKEIRAVEKQRFITEQRYRNIFTIVMAVSGAFLGLTVLYITDILLEAQERGYYNYTLARPSLTNFFIFSASGIASGVLLAIILIRTIGQFRNFSLSPWRWIIIGAVFGSFISFLTGLLHLPLDLTTLYIKGEGNKIPLGFGLAMREALLDTPLFLYTYGLVGIYIAWFSGTIFGFGGWLSYLWLKYKSEGKSSTFAYILPIITSALIMVITIFTSLEFLRVILSILGGNTDIAP